MVNLENEISTRSKHRTHSTSATEHRGTLLGMQPHHRADLYICTCTHRFARMYPRVYNDSADLVWLNRKSLRWSAARNCGSLGSAVFHGGNVSVSYALSVAFDVG